MQNPKRLAFVKMEGAGNDYIYVEEFERSLKNPSVLAQRVSDRHFGVGSDGLVLMGPSDCADFRMRIFNADGSEAEMCGNATRCVGKYLYERGFVAKKNLTLETLAGIRVLDLTVRDGQVESVRVDMGAPRLAPAEIPMRADGEHFIDQEILVDGKTYRGTAVSMGNPHLVVPVTDLDALDLPRLGPLFEHHALFPKRVNTEFIQTLDRSHVRARVWERGAGETLACGTGACAVACACALTGVTDRRVVVQLRGGDLAIEWAENNMVYKSGPARFVCDGEYHAPDDVAL